MWPLAAVTEMLKRRHRNGVALPRAPHAVADGDVDEAVLDVVGTPLEVDTRPTAYSHR